MFLSLGAIILTFMKKLLLLLFLLVLFIAFPKVIKAQQNGMPRQDFYKAKVIKITSEGKKSVGDAQNSYQDIEVQLLNGNQKGRVVDLENGGEMNITPEQRVKAGDMIVVLSQMDNTGEGARFSVYEKYRANTVIAIIVAFFALAVLIAGLRGFGSFAGLVISLFIILSFIIPQILAGQNPLVISILGSVIILLITTYLAHGISKTTTVALLSTFVSLLLTAFIASFFVNLAGLTGLNEETASLQFGLTKAINLHGLLLGGIIIGTLGALNDITTTQAAAVFQLAKTDKSLSIEKLFEKGFLIGREHVASLINTLVLAYAGSSLVVFIFLVLNPTKVPYWVIINSELVSGEIVRTIAGSMGLMLVVPIATLAAAVAVKKWK